jgi:hypothetical protein
MITGIPGSSPVMVRQASVPLPFGILMSITTTSGRRMRASRTASSPDSASPTTVNPSCRSSRAPSPMRTTSCSSAMRMRIAGALVAVVDGIVMVSCVRRDAAWPQPEINGLGGPPRGAW